MTDGIHAGPLPQADPQGEHHPGELKRASSVGHVASGVAAWWRKGRSGEAPAPRVEPVVHHVGPLPHAFPDDEHHVGPLEEHVGPIEPPAAPVAKARARVKKSWREKRWERRRRRRFTEEVLGWVLVPVIVISGFWAVRAGLGALGTNFTSLIQGIKMALSGGGR